MTEVLFDFYELLVENVFGSISLALVGVALGILLILFITRTSKIFILYWMMFYIVVMGALYIGALALVLGFIFATIYTLIAIIRIVFRPD